MKKFITCLLVITLVFSCFVGLIACKPKTDENTIRLIEVIHSVFYAPLYIAIENGYFKDAGLNVELSVGGGADKCMTALIAEQADIGLMGPEASIYVYNEGRTNYPTIFGQLTKKDGSFLIGRKNIDNFNWAKLENSEILGGRRGGVPAMTLEHALKKNNLIDGHNIKLNYDVQFDMIIPVFESGTGDFCTMFEPAASAYVSAGKGVILASVGEEAGDMPFTAFMANQSYLNENATKIEAFTLAITKAINFLYANDSKTVANALHNSFLETDVNILANSIESYKKIGAYNKNLIMKEEDFYHLQDVIIASGIMDKRANFDILVNNSFAQKFAS